MQKTNDFNDNEIVPISAISHHLYCQRQNALIHTEGVFFDNELTISGNIGHEKVDQELSYIDHGLHKETSLRVYSDQYGLSGIADIIEFPETKPPFPIDYKNGRIASWKNQEAQLCAIALCLEEMLNCKVPEGAIYHIKSKKRHLVVFNSELREITLKAISEIRENLVNNYVPKAIYSKKCLRCSLKDLCLPEVNRLTKVKSIFVPINSSREIMNG